MKTILEYVINQKIKTYKFNISDIEDIYKTPYIYNGVTITTNPDDIKDWLKLSDDTKQDIILHIQKTIDIINKKDKLISHLSYYRGSYNTFVVRHVEKDKEPLGWLIYHDGKDYRSGILKIKHEFVEYSDWTDSDIYITDPNKMITTIKNLHNL